jgi:hypothetical protein
MTAKRVLLCTFVSACVVMAGCRRHRSPTASDLFNDDAKLVGALPYPVLQWTPLTTSVDRSSFTTATLFGNDAAVSASRSGQAIYPAGAVLGLVTWRQRDDPHWFGARIPAALVSVEFVEFGTGAIPVYRHFAGSPLSEQPDSANPLRTAAIESMKPVRLP